MEIIITAISILVITGAVWLFNEVRAFKICPICAGVAGTWLWMLVGVLGGYLALSDFQLPMSILMGGSVVGIAYQIEKRLPSNRSPLFWKVVFIPIGFVAVYSLLSFQWLVFGVLTALLVIISLWFIRVRPERSQITKELEEKMKDCC